MTTADGKLVSETEHRPGVRWWPAVVILALAASRWGYIWFVQDGDRQAKNLRTAFLLIATTALLLLWILLVSRLSWTLRLLILGGVVGIFGLSAALLEIRGVTGDLVPVVGWRWQSAPPLPDEQGGIEMGKMLEQGASSHDYPQIYGPDRNGILPGPRLATDWSAQPPVEIWRQPIGGGWSGFAVVGEYAVTMEQRGETELVTCYHLLTGALIWKHADEEHYQSSLAGEGPRTIPTIVDDRVFTLGATGTLNCLELTDGKLVWSKNIVSDNDSSVPEWGVSGSPLVTDGMVIVCAGGENGRSLVAYDKATGDRVWSGGDDRAHYSSPVLANIANTRQVLIFNSRGIAAHKIDSGQILWKADWERGGSHITMPIVLPNGRVLISSGYGVGSELLQVEHDSAGDWSTTRVWKSSQLKSKFANMIVRDGYIYGLDDGIMTCLEVATGDRQWKKGRYGHGQMILIDDLLMVMSEKGDLVLLDPVPDEHRELTRFSIFRGKTWNPPALAGHLLLVRTDSEAACFRLPAAEP